MEHAVIYDSSDVYSSGIYEKFAAEVEIQLNCHPVDAACRVDLIHRDLGTVHSRDTIHCITAGQRSDSTDLKCAACAVACRIS